MTTKTIQCWDKDEDRATALAEAFVGKSIKTADLKSGTLTLSDGTKVTIEKETFDCCSYLDLVGLAKTENIITAVSFGDNEDETGGIGSYTAWIKVVTEAGSLNIVQAEGSASNGYYLHGFALEIQIEELAPRRAK